MAAAELVHPDLRTKLQGAKASGTRCLKAVVTEQPVTAKNEPGDTAEGDASMTPEAGSAAVLALAASVQEELGEPLEKEFERCIEALLEDSAPCLLAFRHDDQENIEGSRWLIVIWLPAAASEAARAAHARSRGLLELLVPNPVFSQEVFASSLAELTWEAVCAEMTSHRLSEVDADSQVAHPRRLPLAPAGPMNKTAQAIRLLQSFANRKEVCLRLTLTGPCFPRTLDANAEGRSVQALAKDKMLPTSSCYFASRVREELLLFVFWCPGSDNSKEDAKRLSDDAQYAVLEVEVLRVVRAALHQADVPGAAQPRFHRVQAHTFEDVLEGPQRAAEVGDNFVSASPAPPRSARASVRHSGAEGVEQRPADWPHDWPAGLGQAATVLFPASLALPERPVPPWRGGSKKTRASSAAGSDPRESRRMKNRMATQQFVY